MNKQVLNPQHQPSLRQIANTPFKKLMLVLQFLSWVLIVASPLIGAGLARVFKVSGAKTAGLILGVFIVGEVLFYATLAFLGKELLVIVKNKLKARFNKKPIIEEEDQA